LSHIQLDETYKNKNILTITLNNHRHLNALNQQMLEELKSAINDVEKTTSTKVLIIKSNVAKAFSTGINTKFASSLSSQDLTCFFSELSDVLNKIKNLNCITIASINGYAFGAGADLAISCDIRLGTSNTQFRFPGPQFGLILGTRRLVNEIGNSKARFITMTNEVLDSKTSYMFSLIHHIETEIDSLYKTSLKKAENLSKLPRHSIKMIKSLTDSHKETNEDYQLTKESTEEDFFQKNFLNYLKIGNEGKK